MLSSYTEFIRRTQYIRDKLDAIRIENKLGGTAVNDVGKDLCSELTCLLNFIKTSRLRKKQYDYILIIIAAYGAFEHFLESIIEELIITMTDVVPSFSQLPEKIRNSHTTLSFESIKRIKDSSRLEIESNTIINLHSCYSSTERYKLNPSAFSHHTSNFRIEMINNIFSKVGINSLCQLIVKDNEYADFANARGGTMSIRSSKSTESFKYIDDFVERRNEVAHGDFPEDLLTIDELENVISSLEMFVRGTTRTVQNHIANLCKKHLSNELGIPIKCYGSDIVCFNLAARSTIQDKQVVFLSTDDTVVAFGRIVEMQINKNNVGPLTSISDLDIGLKLSIPVKKNYSYHLFNSDNEKFQNVLSDLPPLPTR